jgi:hypothetical protein
MSNEASAIFRRKVIYEELHPEAKRGEDWKSDQVAKLAKLVTRVTIPAMCGRFTQNLSWAEIHRLADLIGQARNLAPRFNIAPTTPIEVIRASDAGNELVPMYWGLIPSSFGRLQTARMIFHFRHSMKVTGERWRKLLQKSRPQAASPWGDRRGSCQRISRNPADRNASSCTEASRR